MTKFADRSDPGYDSILGELERWVTSVRSAERDALPAGMALSPTSC